VKCKVALLFMAAIGSSVLMVSAQTPYLAQTGPRPALDPTPYTAPQPLPQPVGYGTASYVGTAGFSGFSPGQSHEEATLANQASEMTRQLSSAKSDSDREKLKGQLSTLLEKQFELRQQRHRKEIESLEGQVKKLRDLVDKRQENRREIIAKRLDQIVQESQGLGW
jgi:hypothetical protein